MIKAIPPGVAFFCLLLSAQKHSFPVKDYMAKKDYQEFKIKLNMKTILLYEEMSGKSFHEVDADSMMLLIYCALVVNNDMNLTKSHFDSIMKNEKILKELMSKVQSELDFMQQFEMMRKTDVPEGNDNAPVKDNKISSLIHMIMLNYNLDINYLMYDMRLWELAPLAKSMEEKGKIDLVEKRFWTYLNICPHIDSKKIKGPEDFLPFPWEKENKKNKSIKFMEDNKDAIIAFFNKNKKEDGAG